MSGLRFRNVDAEPSDDVRTWPYEALTTVIDRGLVPDWRPVLAEIRRSPWGSVAQRVERYLAYREPDAVGTLFALAIERARTRATRLHRCLCPRNAIRQWRDDLPDIAGQGRGGQDSET